MVYTKSILKGLEKPDLIELVSQLQSEMNFDIEQLTPEFRDIVRQTKKS